MRQLPRVLVADHESPARGALCRELEQAGYVVATAEDGEDVLLLCDINPPDVLILEAKLPGMDGFDVCEYVRHASEQSDLTLILVTTATDPMTRTYLGQMADYVGADYYFTKPCDPKVLAQLLDEVYAEPLEQATARTTCSPTRAKWPTSRSFAGSRA